MQVKAEIIHNKLEQIVIQWSIEGFGFGQLTMTYNGKGGYDVDAEYLGLKKTIAILQAVKLDDLI